VLGSGSGGTVYSTLHKPSQMAMAVKVIPIDASAEMQRHILAELEILHRCDSPHIIR
jgi:serine/threonine protein kinase